MLAGRRDHDDARLRVVIDVPHDRRKLGPELRHHRVELGGALEHDMRDAVRDLDVEAAIGHGVSPKRRRQMAPGLSVLACRMSKVWPPALRLSLSKCSVPPFGVSASMARSPSPFEPFTCTT